MAKKVNKHQITLKEAIENIPHDWTYCNDSGRCPYWRLRKCHSKGQMIRKAKKAHIMGIPVWYSRHHELEYCTFLKTYLSIQDGCKDCGINEDLTPEMIAKEIEADKAYHDKYHADEPYTPVTEAEILDANGYEKPFRARLSNREYADFYKEIFPEESEFIDKIVEEDNLTYWHKEKESE